MAALYLGCYICVSVVELDLFSKAQVMGCLLFLEKGVVHVFPFLDCILLSLLKTLFVGQYCCLGLTSDLG